MSLRARFIATIELPSRTGHLFVSCYRAHHLNLFPKNALTLHLSLLIQSSPIGHNVLSLCVIEVTEAVTGLGYPGQFLEALKSALSNHFLESLEDLRNICHR